MKLKYYELLDSLVEEGLVPGKPDVPLGPVTGVVEMIVWALSDDTNAAYRMKWPEDWLKERGYIRGDSRKDLRWNRYPEQFISRQEQYLIIRLREAQ